MQLLCSPTNWIWECWENNLCFWKHICCKLLILSPQFAEVVIFFFFFNEIYFCLFLPPPSTSPKWHLRSLQFVSNIIVNDLKIISLDWNFFWKISVCVFFFFFFKLMLPSHLKWTFLRNALNNVLATSCLLCAFYFICPELHFPCIPLKKTKCHQ